MANMESQVIFVSGAATGHGAAYARGVVRAGGTVVANDINEKGLAVLQAELGKRCIALPGDMGRADELIREAISRADSLDAIINNAGWSGAAHIVDMTADV